MKVHAIKLMTAFLLPLIVAACIEKPLAPPPAKTITITGKVLRSDNQAPIVGALVTLLKTPPLSVKTDSSGFYRLSFDIDAPFSALLVTLISGFAPDTATVNVIPGKDITRDIALKEVLVTGLP
ncbi:MAG: carboxypeptidase-like regulatory domain-containing protein, partial [Bacteroidota bacterium]